MTFSNDINKELSQLKISNKIEALLELSSILKTNASISIRNAFININFSTESEYVVKRINNLIKYIYDYEANISIVKNDNIMKEGLYNLTIEDEDIANRIINDSGFDYFGNYQSSLSTLFSRIKSVHNGTSAFLRGAYLGSGTMVDPKKSYLLELVFTKKEDVDLLNMVLEEENILPLYKERKDKKIVYFKNSEYISDFLNTIKANKALLALENVKVEKDLRNNINRKMNFDMANLNKTIQTAMKQIQYIEILENEKALPEDLKELAYIRKDNPELSIKELGELMNPPLKKSSVAYKMNKLKNLAKKFDKWVLTC